MEQKNLSRKEKALETKEKLFVTAVKLIQEKGYTNVLVQDICEKAGVAKGTFYVHYKSKEDIVRESYYVDMAHFIQKEFDSFLLTKPTLKEKIEKFLLLELAFTQYIGYELTCLAYTMNLSACVPGPCKHLEKRAFTKPLKALLEEGVETKVFANGFTQETIFLYLETSVRGMMASWCFANGQFSIMEEGEKYLKTILRGIYK